MSESYKRFPFQYDIPPVPPPSTFAIWATPDGNTISPEVVADTVTFTSSDGSITITSVPATDTIDFVTAGGPVDQTFTADVDIADRELVYISSSNGVSLADASSSTAKDVIGFALNAATATNNVLVRLSGPIDSLSGISPGDTLFLSHTTPGAFTTTAPATGTSAYVVKLARARTTVSALVDISIRGRRA